MTYRCLRSAAAALSFTILAITGAAAQDYPARPIRVIVPVSPSPVGFPSTPP
jgi:tripartite-type tricarboxylate transporter receptor subunit TctC